MWSNPGYAPPGYPSPMMGGPMGVPPGGMVGPNCGLSIPSQTPDVTMVPTTPQGPLPNRAGWVQQYQFGGMPFWPRTTVGATSASRRLTWPGSTSRRSLRLRSSFHSRNSTTCGCSRTVEPAGHSADKFARSPRPHRLGLRIEDQPAERMDTPSSALIRRSTAISRRALASKRTTGTHGPPSSTRRNPT